jgi:hypothetical protein
VKKRAKKTDFFGIEKRHSKKEKKIIGYSESEFRVLSFKKKLAL